MFARAPFKRRTATIGASGISWEALRTAEPFFEWMSTSDFFEVVHESTPLPTAPSLRLPSFRAPTETCTAWRYPRRAASCFASCSPTAAPHTSAPPLRCAAIRWRSSCSKLVHGAAFTPPACAGEFGDVACPGLFADWIEQLAAEGVTAGCAGRQLLPARGRHPRPDGRFPPQDRARPPPTRRPDCQGLFPDVPCPSLFAPLGSSNSPPRASPAAAPAVISARTPPRHPRPDVRFLRKVRARSELRSAPRVPVAVRGRRLPVTHADWIEQLYAEHITAGCAGPSLLTFRRFLTPRCFPDSPRRGRIRPPGRAIHAQTYGGHSRLRARRQPPRPVVPYGHLTLGPDGNFLRRLALRRRRHQLPSRLRHGVPAGILRRRHDDSTSSPEVTSASTRAEISSWRATGISIGTTAWGRRLRQLPWHMRNRVQDRDERELCRHPSFRHGGRLRTERRPDRAPTGCPLGDDDRGTRLGMRGGLLLRNRFSNGLRRRPADDAHVHFRGRPSPTRTSRARCGREPLRSHLDQRLYRPRRHLPDHAERGPHPDLRIHLRLP